jgi:hypothetical protein
MYVRLYSIQDKVAQEFGPIFQAKNDSIALRQFKAMIFDPKNAGLRVDDYVLVHIGDFDTETGIIDTQTYVRNEVLVEALDEQGI